MITFWVKVKGSIYRKKLLWLFLGNFWNNLGYFSFQHLVTLVRRPIPKKTLGTCKLLIPKLKHDVGPLVSSI